MKKNLNAVVYTHIEYIEVDYIEMTMGRYYDVNAAKIT